MFPKVIASLELGNLNRKKHILTRGIMYLGPASGVLRARVALGSPEAEFGMDDCVAGTPREPGQPPTPSPALKMQHIQTTDEAEGVRYDG